MGGFVEVLKYDPINKYCSFVIISPWINLMEIGAEGKVDISHVVLWNELHMLHCCPLTLVMAFCFSHHSTPVWL